MKTNTSLLFALTLLICQSAPVQATQHFRPSALPSRTVKTIPTLTVSRPTTTQPPAANPSVTYPGAIPVGAKSSSRWLLKQRFHTKDEGGLQDGCVFVSFLPGRPETIENLCIRATRNEILVDNDAQVLYFGGLQSIRQFGNGFLRVQKKFAEWKSVAVSNAVDKLDKEMTSADFPPRMVIGSSAYKITPHFVVEKLYPNTFMEKIGYFVEFRAVPSDQFNVPIPNAKTETLFRFSEAGFARFIALLAPQAAFEKLQAMKNAESEAKKKEDLFK